jgi:hypothetical protein
MIDFDARYSIAQYPGVAFYLKGWEQKWEPVRVILLDEETSEEYEEDDPYGEGEWVDDTEGRLRAVMVGDDRVFLVEMEDLTPLGDEDYCSCCGQIGCRWG